ncbi:single-pass membrane and coiled-coil domain-containing protein 3 [Bombina bombina]|uniref:single-pass membrane and coiled-coil domain-containing protein 3 n=1 Tax=Bombina bombina TaxID=8345 RepID=UPI00235B3076|nr:single-pass membrane and coiled-coil domain-containing protein 3 [Bombina bombina]
MSLKNLLYPNNPKRREEVSRLHRQLLDCMASNFQQTNKLILALKKHLGCQISPIEMKYNSTIKENCNIFIKTMEEIQQEVQKIDEQLKTLIEPTLYQKLHDLKEPEPQKVEIVQKVISVIMGKATATASAIIVKLVSSNITNLIVNKLVTLLAQIGASVLGSLGITLLGLGIDAIICAILGAVERDQLETSMKEYEESLAEFKPASETYQQAIVRVITALEEMFNSEVAPSLNT